VYSPGEAVLDFTEKLAGAVERNNSLLCLGLDPDTALMPDKMGIFEFNKAIIDATADLVSAYKPNIAFYEALGSWGLDELKRTRDYIPEDIPVIIDAKRGDIGNTARAYARGLFDYLNADAVTVSPYLGYDSLEPFIEYSDKGVFVLCRTSNAGAADFQSLSCEIGGGHEPLYGVVAGRVNRWNTRGNLGLVVGATYPEELKQVRQDYPDILLLIPGIGAQGGDLAQVVSCGVDARKQRTIINSSRQVLYASKGANFVVAARQVAEELRNGINSILEK
jgi:orotidine-5'-phosphate decarboxylase